VCTLGRSQSPGKGVVKNINNLPKNHPQVKAKKRARRRLEGVIPFTAIERSAYFMPEWNGLSAAAKTLYPRLKANYNGSNNGEIELPYEDMKNCKGCSAHSTLSRAFKELEKKEWIELTQLGGLFRRINKYKLTFKHERFQ